MIICQFCKQEAQPNDVLASAATLNIGTTIIKPNGDTQRGGGFIMVLPPAPVEDGVQYVPHKQCVLTALAPFGFQGIESVRPFNNGFHSV